MPFPAAYTGTVLGPRYPMTSWAGGRTRQIIIYPATADVGKRDFLFRVSTATVTRSGPFTTFRGYDRILLLLEGKGIELTHGTNRRRVLRDPLRSYWFSGGWTTHCSLLGGRVIDFNVMTRRGKAFADVEVHDVDRGATDYPWLEAPFHLLYCVAGSAEVALLSSAQVWNLKKGETLFLDRSRSREPHHRRAMSIRGDRGDALVIGVSVFLKAAADSTTEA